MVSDQERQRALTQKQTLWGGGALERGHGALLEPLAQLGDTLGSVGAMALPVEAAELVAGQTAMSGARMVREECQRALTQKQTLSGRQARTSARSRRSP